jgi:hypothetical protein
MIVGSITKGNCKFRASGDYLFHVMMFKQARVVVEMRKVWHINWLMQMLHLGSWGLKPHIRMKINHPENELKDKKNSIVVQAERGNCSRKWASICAEMEKISTALRCTKLDEKHMNLLEKVMCYQVFVDDGKIVGCFASKLSKGLLELPICALFLKDT